MPIIALQRRLVPVGRIRMGEKKTARNGKKYPAKLDTWRLTSADPARLRAVAEVYGGNVRPWEEQHEVYTEAKALDIVVIPGQAVSQHMELWGQRPDRGDDKPRPVVCLRRCDGVTELLTDRPCICATEPGDDTACKPVTHLMVMLPKIAGIGTWRVTTRGNNAAAELLGTAEILEQLTAAGELVPARLRLDQRTSVNPDTGVTNHFVVPVIDIDIALNDVFSGHALGMGSTREIATAPYAIEAAPTNGNGNAGGGNGAPRFTPIQTPAIAAESRSMHDQFGEFEDALDTKAQARAGRSNATAPIPSTGVKVKSRAEVDAEMSAATPVAVDEGESGGDASPPAASSPASPVNRVAIAAREAGLDDDGRHNLCLWASAGREPSSKLLTDTETTAAIDAARQIKAGTHTLEAKEGGSGGFVLLDTKFRFAADDPATGSADPVTVEGMPLDDLRVHLRGRLEPLGDAGKQAWKAAGLPALSRLGDDQRDLALATVLEAEVRPF